MYRRAQMIPHNDTYVPDHIHVFISNLIWYSIKLDHTTILDIWN